MIHFTCPLIKHSRLRKYLNIFLPIKIESSWKSPNYCVSVITIIKRTKTVKHFLAFSIRRRAEAQAGLTADRAAVIEMNVCMKINCNIYQYIYTCYIMYTLYHITVLCSRNHKVHCVLMPIVRRRFRIYL